MSELQEIKLETLDGGGAAELFNNRFEELLRNIADPNTDPEAVREITLKVKVKPHKSRELGDLSYNISLKTAGPRSVSAMAYFGKTRDGRLIAQGKDPRQMELDETPGSDPAVRPITARAEAR